MKVNKGGDPAKLIARFNSSSLVHLVYIANFFEDIAVAVDLEKVDEIHLQKFFKTVIAESYPVLEPWIEELRKQSEQHDAFTAFERLSGRWRASEESRWEQWGFPPFP